MTLCRKLDIPVTEIFSIDNIHEHEHLRSVQLFEVLEHPTEGNVVAIRPTALFSKTPSRITRHAPNIGEQTDEVLGELGYSADFILQTRK